MYHDFTKKYALADLMNSINVCDLLSKDDCDYIGLEAKRGYDLDVTSRNEWTDRQAEGNKLALQVVEEKTFPWVGCANVKFPLVTVAALQYASKAYPSLVNGADLVKCRVIGEDPKGEKTARAKRISTHMSWQNLEQDKSWEEDMDKLFLVQAISGCAFTKRVWEPGPSKQVTMLVMPKNFVTSYWTKSIAESIRYTHTFPLSRNNIVQREMDGRFRKVDIAADGAASDDQIEQATNEREGVSKPQDEENITPWFTGEQYCWWDLDGDGYEEPYIVTFDVASGQVRRIVARFRPSGIRTQEGTLWEPGREVYKITPIAVFTKYGFIPSPDGGFYDLGLGSILGPLNATVDTTINQMLDAGTMATLGGGFLGRGFKGKAGPITFQPNQWYPVDAPGDDLRKNVLPLPVREPSSVLFQLLGLIIQYSERIVSVNELQMGENIGQNTPAETARTMNQNGARAYSAIHKRTWRSMRDDYRIQFDLNKMYLEVDVEYEDLTTGKGAMIRPDDYTGSSEDIRPAADPHIVSDTQRVENAKLVFANAYQAQGHNKYLATVNLYKALGIPNIEELVPQPMQPDPQDPKKMVPAKDFPPMPNPKMMEAQRKDKELQFEVQSQQQEFKLKAMEMIEKKKKMNAEVVKNIAQAQKAIAEAKGVKVDARLKELELHIKAWTENNDDIMELMQIMQGAQNGGSGDGGSGLGAMEGKPANAGVPPVSAPNGAGHTGPMA